MRRKDSGQALVIVVLFLPVVIGFWLLAIELAWRYTTFHAVTDALQAANRSAVQTFDYAAFANNQLALAEPNRVIAIARRLAATNLSGVNGLIQSPAAVAATAQWTVLPAGGECMLEPRGPALHFPTAALCSVADVELVSPLGMHWMIQVYAADTLDQSAALAMQSVGAGER